jgi:hypothetical protein
MEMTIEINRELQRVIYIEYQGRRVHDVITAFFVPKSNGGPYWRCCNWDFEKDCRQIERFMHYHSGSGGNMKEIQAPHYIPNTSASYWMDADAKFKGRPKNIIKREKPMLFGGEPNPFNRSREIYSVDYCKYCKKYYDQDSCDEHHVFEEGELRYHDGGLVE